MLAVGQAFRERALEVRDGRRPDLHLRVNPQTIICDVVVTHSLSPAYINNRIALRPLGAARKNQWMKHLKYDRTAAQHHAQMLAFFVETCGGMAPDAVTLLHIIADVGEQKLSVWPRREVLRRLMNTVSIAVQRGNAMTFLAGHTRAMRSDYQAMQEEQEEE